MTDLKSYLDPDKKKKDKNTDSFIMKTKVKKPQIKPRIVTRRKSSLSDLEKQDIIELLKDVVEDDPSFSSYVAYVSRKILSSQPSIPPSELSRLLNIPLGKAFVVLERIKSDQTEP